MSSTSLHNSIQGLKRRCMTLGAGCGFGWSLFAAAGVVAAAMWLDLVFELPPAVRAATLGAAVIAGLFLLVSVAAAFWRSSSPARLARRMDEVGGTGGQILSGVDLMLGRGLERAAPMTVGLSQLAITRAGQLAAAISRRDAAPAKPLYWPCISLGLLCAVLGLVAVFSPRLAMTQWSRFTDPFGDHPPYSRLTISVEPGDARVVYGASLDIRATVTGGAADSVQVILQTPNASPEALPMFLEPGGQWRATLASITEPATYHVRARSARSQKFGIDLITVPKLQRVRFRVTPPAYTHRPPYDGPLPQEGLAGLPGTRVEVWATSNRPLSAGLIQLVPASPAGPTTAPATQPAANAMTPVADNSSEVTGSFTIDRPGKLTLNVTDIQGQKSSDALTATVSLLNDSRPFVRVLDPKPQSFATPDAILQVQLLAEDDYGISRLQLFRGLNESRVRDQTIDVPTPPVTRFPAAVPLPLGDYGLNPGDVVKLFGRVEDNDPLRAKGSESTVVVVQIISQEQMQRMMIAQEGLEVLLSKYEQARRRLEALREPIEKLNKDLAAADANSPLTEEQRKKLKELADQLEKDAREIAEAAKEKLPFDIDKALNGQLEQAAEALKEMGQTVKKLASAAPSTAGKAAEGFKEIAEAFAQKDEQFDQEAAKPLAHLEKVFPLKEAEAEFITLYERQRDLAERMAALVGVRGEDDPAAKVRMRDLEEEQRQIRTDLQGLLDKINDRAAQLPEDARLDELRQTALVFAKAVRDSKASPRMTDAESALAEFTGSVAHAAARDAADILEQFIKKCQGMGEQAMQGMGFQPKLASALGQTVEQLLEAEGLGRGNGTGNGNGYSMRRSSLRNVGLYGSRPLRSQTAGAGFTQAGGAASGNPSDHPGDPGQDNTSSGHQARGQAEVPVPAQYRHRVSEYFQRVSDELSQ